MKLKTIDDDLTLAAKRGKVLLVNAAAVERVANKVMLERSIFEIVLSFQSRLQKK